MTQELTFTRKSLLILVATLIVVGVLHAQNMFNFPYYQDVEGTNMSNAFSILNEDRLSPYTYAYEEPPAGSYMMSAWMLVNRSIAVFDSPIEAGRALMLVAHILTCALIYAITRKVTQLDLAALIAVLVFAFSPLAIALQRRVLLDNLMIVFLLAALFQMLGYRRKLSHYLTSAVFFALAVLTKGAALYFLPAFLFGIRINADPHHKRFAFNLWLAVALMLISFYPLYAQMKQELMPQGWFLGGDFPHVSLFESITDRGAPNGRFLNMANGLESSFDLWTNLENITADPVIFLGGLASFAFAFIFAIDNRLLRTVVAMTVCAFVFILFGGTVFDSHAIILLPLFAIMIGAITGAFSKLIGRLLPPGIFRLGLKVVVAVALLYPFWIYYSSRLDIYTMDQVSGQLEAIEWLQKNTPEDSVIVTDNFAFVDLRETHPNTEDYFKVQTDPQIRDLKLDRDVCAIDYLVTTPQVNADVDNFDMDYIRQTLDNSEILITYPNNGWPVQIRQVKKVNCAETVQANEDAS
jgi:4-amino-4-deoxy-L-arabinose transferase-like glycosyltransferase